LSRKPESTAGLPEVIVAWLIYPIVGFVILPPLDLEHPFAITLLVVIGNLVYLVGGTVAILLHFRPNHSRRLKYSIILGLFGSSLLTIPQSLYAYYKFTNSVVATTLFTLLNIWPFIVAAIILTVGNFQFGKRYYESNSLDETWAIFAFTFFSLPYTQALSFGLLPINGGLFLLILTTRYVVVEIFKGRPILYLRSFHYDKAAEVFGQAIAPAISRFGVVRGLVNGEQTASVLFSRSSIWRLGLFATVPDSEWQEWVERELPAARLIIIDCSIASESVLWEIDTSMKYLVPERVLVLVNESAPQLAGVNQLSALRYDTRQASIAVLRSRIERWAQTALPGDRPWIAPLSVALWGLILLLGFLHILFAIVQ
jgi:hypothetical protein